MRTNAVALLLTLFASPALGQTAHYAKTFIPPVTRVDTVIPGKEYAAGLLHRIVLGTQYRDLWVTPIEVPVLDLEKYAGGLTPEKRGGSRQTIGLHLKGADGLEYNFRSVDKDPANALPPALKKSPVEKIFQDQMSAQYPAAGLIASKLLDATGVLHAHPRLYVMPDDPRLGQFREEFAGLLGTIEERRMKYEGARQIVPTLELFDSLRTNPGHQIAASEYLKARLMDVLMGDWDRHSDQWQWAAFPNGPGEVIWRPVPEDRDWAFAKMDGPIATLVRQYFPQTIGFDRDYPPILDLTWTAKDLDRRLLSELEWKTWDSVVADIQTSLTDSAIHAAVLYQPVAFQQKAGAWLEDALRHRRDELPKAAKDFYGLLTEEVDVHATDRSEVAEITYEPAGTVLLTIAPRKPPTARPTFTRRFYPNETHEVRLYLHGGEDVAVVHGERQHIRVRVIGGEIDRLVDSSGTGVGIYPDRVEHLAEPRAKHVEKPAKHDKAGEADGGPSVPDVTLASETFAPLPRGEFLQSPPIDWGHRWTSVPWVEYHPGQGIVVGYQTNRFTYGFRANPYRKRFKVKLGWAFGAGGPRIESFAEDRKMFLFFHERVAIGARFDVKVSKVETVRFFGYGNETVRPNPASDARYIQDYIRVAPSIFYDGQRFNGSIAPMIQLSNPDRVMGTLLDRAEPLGANRLVLAGIDGHGAWNLGQPIGKGLGGRLRLDSRWARSISGDEAHFFRGSTEVAGFTRLPVPTNPTLAVRAGAIKVWGLYPFQEAALLGGQRNLRGYDTERFEGDAATYVGTDLRFPLVKMKGIQGGVVMLADAGRVYLQGEDSHTWHRSYGGGVWGGSPDVLVLNLIVGHGEDFVVNVYTGFGF